MYGGIISTSIFFFAMCGGGEYKRLERMCDSKQADCGCGQYNGIEWKNV